MQSLVDRMCAPDEATAETAPRFAGPPPPEGPERDERIRALEAHRLRLVSRFVEHSHTAASVQHAWGAFAARLTRGYRETSRHRRELEDSIAALRESGHEARRPKSQAARLARLRASWAEVEGFVDEACGERNPVHAVVTGKANTVQLDGRAATISRAAGGLDRGVASCYDGDELSLVGFFQLWSEALEELKSEVKPI